MCQGSSTFKLVVQDCNAPVAYILYSSDRSAITRKVHPMALEELNSLLQWQIGQAPLVIEPVESIDP